jgi:hypothetical protein
MPTIGANNDRQIQAWNWAVESLNLKPLIIWKTLTCQEKWIKAHFNENANYRFAKTWNFGGSLILRILASRSNPELKRI